MEAVRARRRGIRQKQCFFTLFFGGKVPIRREAANFFNTFRRKTKNRVLHHFFPLFLTAQLEHFQFYTTFSRFFWPRNRVLHHFFPFFLWILPRSGNAFSTIFSPLFCLKKRKSLYCFHIFLVEFVTFIFSEEKWHCLGAFAFSI